MVRRVTERESSENSNVIKVTLVPLGGEVKTVALKEDSTVGQTVEAAGYDSDNVEVRNSDGDVLGMEDIVEDQDELTLLSDSKVEGGK